MAISPYSQMAMAQYTPLSMQEIMMPAAYMREQHNQMEDAYSAMSDELEKVSMIAASDPSLADSVNNYRNSLIQNMEQLSSRGYNPNMRKSVLGLKTQYTKDIAPIGMAYQIKQELVKQDQQRRLQDPTWRGEDPNNIMLGDIIKSGMQMPQVRGASAAMVSKMVGDTLAPYAKRTGQLTQEQLNNMVTLFHKSGVGKEQIDAYIHMIQNYGFDPNDGGAGTELVKAATKNAKNILGVIPQSEGGWATDDDISTYDAAGFMGGTSMIGQTQSSIGPNPEYDMKKQKYFQDEGFNNQMALQRNQYEQQDKRDNKLHERRLAEIEAQNQGRIDAINARNDNKSNTTNPTNSSINTQFTPTPSAGIDYKNNIDVERAVSRVVNTDKSTTSDKAILAAAKGDYNSYYGKSLDPDLAKYIYEKYDIQLPLAGKGGNTRQEWSRSYDVAMDTLKEVEKLQTEDPEAFNALLEQAKYGNKDNLGATPYIAATMAAGYIAKSLLNRTLQNAVLPMTANSIMKTAARGLSRLNAIGIGLIMADMKSSEGQANVDLSAAIINEINSAKEVSESFKFIKEGMTKELNRVPSDKEIEAQLRNHFNDISKMSGTNYGYNQASLYSQYKTDAEFNYNSLLTKESIILERNNKGRWNQIKYDDIGDNKLKTELNKPGRLAGVKLNHNGKSYYEFTTTYDGKTFNVLVPSEKLDIALSTSNTISRYLQSGVVEPIRININYFSDNPNNRDGNNAIIFKEFENGRINTYIKPDSQNTWWDVNQMVNQELSNLGKGYFKGGETRSEINKGNSNFIPINQYSGYYQGMGLGYEEYE